MFRARIPLAAAVIIVALTAVVVTTLGSTISKTTQTTVESRVEHGERAFPQLDLLRALNGEAPLLLLDDVFSELDPSRRAHLVRRIGVRERDVHGDLRSERHAMREQRRRDVQRSGSMERPRDVREQGMRGGSVHRGVHAGRHGL